MGAIRNGVPIFLVLLFTIVQAQNENSPDLPTSSNMYNCGANDAECWNRECLHWTNYIRQQAGVAPMTMGTTAMLSNAVGHSNVMANNDGLNHQNLIVQLACGVNVNAENIAYNFATSNPAWMCMNQWKKSPGHYSNIINGGMRSTVCGVRIRGNKVFCTQTMSVGVPTSTCPAAPTNGQSGNASANPGSPAPTVQPPPKPASGNTCVPNPKNCEEVNAQVMFNNSAYPTCCVCCSRRCSCSNSCTCGSK